MKPHRVDARTSIVCLIIGILAVSYIMRYMPASSPDLDERQETHLERLGARIKDHRKQLAVTAKICAEAAGVSRTTLHRIEAGNPSVTIGAYLNVANALGTTLTVPFPKEATGDVPIVRVADYPGLRQLAWQVDARTEISETDALNLYEREWRHLDHERLTDREKLFIHHLADTYSHGELLV